MALLRFAHQSHVCMSCSQLCMQRLVISDLPCEPDSLLMWLYFPDIYMWSVCMVILRIHKHCLVCIALSCFRVSCMYISILWSQTYPDGSQFQPRFMLIYILSSSEAVCLVSILSFAYVCSFAMSILHPSTWCSCIRISMSSIAPISYYSHICIMKPCAVCLDIILWSLFWKLWIPTRSCTLLLYDVYVPCMSTHINVC